MKLGWNHHPKRNTFVFKNTIHFLGLCDLLLVSGRVSPCFSPTALAKLLTNNTWAYFFPSYKTNPFAPNRQYMESSLHVVWWMRLFWLNWEMFFSWFFHGFFNFSRYILELPHTHSSSHHQDYSIFSRESQPKSSFVTVTGLGGGVDRRYVVRTVMIWHHIQSEASSIFHFKCGCFKGSRHDLLLMVQKSQTTTFWMYKTLVPSGRNYPPQLVSLLDFWTINTMFWWKWFQLKVQRFPCSSGVPRFLVTPQKNSGNACFFTAVGMIGFLAWWTN